MNLPLQPLGAEDGVLRPSLQQQHLLIPVFCQPVGQHTPSRTRTNYDLGSLPLHNTSLTLLRHSNFTLLNSTSSNPPAAQRTCVVWNFLQNNFNPIETITVSDWLAPKQESWVQWIYQNCSSLDSRQTSPLPWAHSHRVFQYAMQYAVCFWNNNKYLHHDMNTPLTTRKVSPPLHQKVLKRLQRWPTS